MVQQAASTFGLTGKHRKQELPQVASIVTAAILYMEPMRLRLLHLHNLAHSSHLGDWRRLQARVQYTTPLVVRLLRGALVE